MNCTELKVVKEDVTLTNREHFCSLAILFYFYIPSLIPNENLSFHNLISIVAEPQIPISSYCLKKLGLSRCNTICKIHQQQGPVV